MKKMDVLVGIIQGVDSDNYISKKEVEAIRRWVDQNYELKSDPICKDLFCMLEEVLEDGVIDDNERELLLDYANDYLIAHDSRIETLNVLDGIIEGIVCDEYINEKEVHSLHRWMKSNRHLAGAESFDFIFKVLEGILEDRVVTDDEKEYLLGLLNTYIADKKSAMKMPTRMSVEKDESDKSEIVNAYEDRINALLTEEKCIYVIKGVKEYSNLSFNIDKLCSLNINDIITKDDIDEEALLRDLLLKTTGSKPYVVSYEEFNLLPNAIVEMLTTLGYRIVVVKNNIYHEFYPVREGISKATIQNDLRKQGENITKKIWDEYLLLSDELFASYQAIEANYSLDLECLSIFEEVEFDEALSYDDDTNVYDFSITEETYLTTLLDILHSESRQIKVIVGKNGLLSYQKSLLKTLSGLGYSVQLVHRTVEKVKDDKLEEYEAILKRKNKSFQFKSIDFYVEPGETLETQKISQGEIVSALVNNATKAYVGNKYNDVFVTAPTGAGKSILFQIPAIYIAEQYELLTVVVTPLIGLMNDQVSNIKTMTDLAATINSDYTPEEKEIIKEEIQNGNKSILYISPETLLSNNPISNLIGDRKIGLFIVDEAHIVTTWGKSFRPDYWYLGEYISYLRQRGGYSFPLATFSATITYGGSDDMHGDIIDSLKMRTGKYEYIAPMRRDDITFDINVVQKKNDYAQEKIKTVEASLDCLMKDGRKTIVYFPYVSQINDFYDRLRANNVENVSKYYGELDKHLKSEFMQEFSNGSSGLMLATKAFGMGIDIDDIEVVYHFAPTGNLCDYVQEIGRAARAEEIHGIAKTDYFLEDFRFINQLFGMSAITNYHLKAILSKLRSVYYEKGSRNFTISPDDFAYIFADAKDFGDAENRLKTAVLMIQKDFELDPYINFKPLIFRPRSMFTRGYFLISDEDAKRISQSRFRRYIYKYADRKELSNKSTRTQHVWDSAANEYRHMEHELVVSHTRDVYVVNFKKMWDECFDEYTFANFKRLFYEGQLRGLEFAANFAQKYLLTVKTSRTSFSRVQDKITLLIEEIIGLFSTSEIGNKHLSLDDISELLSELKEVKLSNDESMAAAETLINVINEYNAGSQFNNFRPFTYNRGTKKYNVKSINVLIKRLKKIDTDFRMKFKAAMDDDSKTFLIDDNAGDNKQVNKSTEMQLAQFLEAFKLATYRVVSGERPEYFVRINSITQIERILSDSNYHSRMVSMVRKRHEQSIQMMTEFFTELNSDTERWDYVERYFVGMPYLGKDNEQEIAQNKL